ncbi:MAG TPA: hypothetical protein PKE35_10710 [Anaerolineales bacterium]|nr:hypothetical protein [Anaerolineales bacterium]HMV95221.1 hypothetical protein [Anaerolineales bacterium]HMX20260.1 hypothetical protein [Anaerolineales bacterium]HMX74717.1 hypothetical protein [Anaerolineales bacterium]HMZ43480.1 hypothetical protein [Anaerolineales bacterium]
MKQQAASIGIFLQRIDRQQIQLILAIASLVALALGSGAPLDGGSGGG